VVHLQVGADEATRMTATAVMLGVETTSDSSAGAERLPVDAPAYKELRIGVLCVPLHVSMTTFTCIHKKHRLHTLPVR
jgi:hypothetical protein